MKPHLKPILPFSAFLFAFLVFVIPVNSQVHYRFFYGKVLIADTREPLANVNISFKGSNMGSVTDQKGAFSFYIDTIPVFMIVSHIGYKTKRVFLDGTSNSMTLYLEKDIHELKEVVIKANKIEPFFRDEHYTIRDYEIDSGLVYLLVYRSRISKEELICKNLQGDTVARSGILSFTPVALFKDCLGYLHVIGTDSIFQVYRMNKALEMSVGVSTAKFNEVLSNCVASTEKILFFKSTFNMGQGVMYYGINRTNKEKKVLSMVTDEYKLKMLRRNPADAYHMSSDLPGGRTISNGLDVENTPSTSMDRASFDEWNWVHKALYRPMKTALYRIGDFICIFDIPMKQLEFYDIDGNFSFKLKINIELIKEGKWTCDILLDETQSIVYTTFQKSTGTTLYRIDLNTGDLHKILTTIHPYPQKISIYKDQVYYLYSRMGDPDNKILFREDL
jgi:hypothetical protein